MLAIFLDLPKVYLSLVLDLHVFIFKGRSREGECKRRKSREVDLFH